MPSFRAMAWLAWLILALAPVHGMPRGAAGGALQAAPASTVAQLDGHGDHAMADQSGCCGDRGHDAHGSMGSAYCAAACGSILPAFALAGLVPVAPEPWHVSPSFALAPSVVQAPPLRPPAG
ncbi:hypothetical protein [Rhodanobacter sp. OR87]|uniref:hypothetical protein n=1 Tax=Rhodanobacter sp. OR87 TaxID=1076523 RepID=UPI001E35C5EF|nr:hypothetical protein [Rhodanobacter sp. OR87]